MSYDVMVFDHLKVPHKSGQLKQWLNTHMEKDVLPDKPPAVFRTFLESMEKFFPSIDHCPEDKLDYGCDYEIHEDFVYMCFGYSVAKEAHDIVKRQAKMDHLGFWDVGQSFDRTFPVTIPGDKWPMILEAPWIKNGRQFVYSHDEIRKILMQMKKMEPGSVCLTDRYENYIQAGGYEDAFIVEVRRYTDAVRYQHMRADMEKESSDVDALVRINDFSIKVPESQIFSRNQVCMLFQGFTDETGPEDQDVFWKHLDI